MPGDEKLELLNGKHSSAISFRTANNNPVIGAGADRVSFKFIYAPASIMQLWIDMNFHHLWDLHQVGNDKHDSLILHARMDILRDGTTAHKWQDGQYPCLFQMCTGGDYWRIMIFSADHPPELTEKWHTIFDYDSVHVDINMNPILPQGWTSTSMQSRPNNIFKETSNHPDETIDYETNMITFMAHAGTDNMYNVFMAEKNFTDWELIPAFQCTPGYQVGILRWTSAYDNRLLLTGDQEILPNLHKWFLLNWRSKQIINGYAVNYSWGNPGSGGSPAGWGLSHSTNNGGLVGSWPHSQKAFLAFETPGPYTLSIDFDNTKNNNGSGTLSASGIEYDCGNSSQAHINGSYNASSTIGINASLTIIFDDHRPYGGVDGSNNAWILTDERLPAERYNLFFDNDSFNASGAYNASSTYKVEVVNGCFFDDPVTFNGDASYSFETSVMTLLSTSYTEAHLTQTIFWTPSIRNYIRINFLKMLKYGESAYDITPKINITYHEYKIKLYTTDAHGEGPYIITLNGIVSPEFSMDQSETTYVYEGLTGPTIIWSCTKFSTGILAPTNVTVITNNGDYKGGVINISDLRASEVDGNLATIRIDLGN